MITKAYLDLHRAEIVKEMKEGKIFVYPTEIFYAVGCNALNKESVLKIRHLKRKSTKPFSIISPNVDWINENCIANKNGAVWVKKLPGPYTLIFKLKNTNCVAKEVNPGLKTLGIRIPKHWISKLVAEADVPVITTSVNKNNEDYMTSLDDLDASIKKSVDFVIYEGEKLGKPSKIIDLTETVKVIER